MGVPLLDLGAADPAAPAADRGGDILPPPADVDAEHVSEQLGRRLPFVAAELPRLPRGKDSHDPAPVIGFKLLWGVDEDKAQRSRGVNGGQKARDVQNRSRGPRGACQRAVGWDVGASFEEGFDIRHPQQGRRGG